MTSYLAYVDDSGDETVSVYTALLIPMDAWTKTLRAWLDFRRDLYDTLKIPASFELHAKDLVQAGKNRPAPSIRYGVNTDLRLRKRVIRRALETINGMSDVTVLACVDPGKTPTESYERLLLGLDQQLALRDSWALVVVDGDGSQQYQGTAHRGLKLDLRRVVEDPWHQGSHVSQLVQMADLASYTVHQAHKQRDSRRYMWTWQAEYLHDREWPELCACPEGAKKALS